MSPKFDMAVLNDPAYVRTNPADVAAALAHLGCAASDAFREFYEQKAGPFSSAHWRFMLLDLIDQDVNIVTQTQECRAEFGLPERYLVISDLVGNAVLVYDCATDALFNMDFEGGDKELVAGTLPPAWGSFNEFLSDYFAAVDPRGVPPVR